MEHKHKEASPLPEVENPPMNAAELEEIGTRIFGRVGWTVKIAKLLGKDASTLRRWRAGGAIEPFYAAAIRDYDRRHTTAETPSWDETAVSPDANSFWALKVVARAQALGNLGAPVGIRVTDSPEGMSITLRVGGSPPLIAWQTANGGFVGLDKLEGVLSKIRIGLENSA